MKRRREYVTRTINDLITFYEIDLLDEFILLTCTAGRISIILFEQTFESIPPGTATYTLNER